MPFREAAERVGLTPVPSPIAPPAAGRGAPPPEEKTVWQPVLDDLARQASGQTVTVRGPQGVVELTGADLAEAADKISRFVPSARIRDILVLGGALDEPAPRALLSWATVTGAALLLEPDRDNVLGMAVWARPTVFAGSVDEIVRLRLAAERHERGWLHRLAHKMGRRPGLPWGRLRAVLVDEPGPLPQVDEIFWRDRGVAVGFLPQCGIAWYISWRGDRHA